MRDCSQETKWRSNQGLNSGAWSEEDEAVRELQRSTSEARS